MKRFLWGKNDDADMIHRIAAVTKFVCDEHVLLLA